MDETIKILYIFFLIMQQNFTILFYSSIIAMDDTQESYHLKEDTTHVVIVFVEGNKEKKNVELVPRSWLILTKRKWLCYYPDQSQYRHVEKWVQKNREPDRENWKQFKVKILKEARKY